jgi:hypothetical protein
MEALVTTPPIPSKETGDRKTRPARFLLGSWGAREINFWRTACSIRDDMTEMAWGRSTMTEVTGRDAAAAPSPESGFPLSNSP